MPLVDRVSAISLYQYNLLVANRIALGVKDIWDGDQNLLPNTPAICVEGGPLERELAGPPSRVTNNLTTYILVYHGTVQDIQITTRETLQIAEAVQDLFHQDLSMGGNVVHGFVTMIEPGYADKGRNWYRTARLIWQGITRTLLQEAA